MANQKTPEELQRQCEELCDKTLASFPYSRTETPGHQALATWDGLVASGRGAPMIVGGDDDLQRIAGDGA